MVVGGLRWLPLLLYRFKSSSSSSQGSDCFCHGGGVRRAPQQALLRLHLPCHPLHHSRPGWLSKLENLPYLDVVANGHKVYFNPTYAIMVTGPPRIGVGPGFDSQVV